LKKITGIARNEGYHPAKEILKKDENWERNLEKMAIFQGRHHGNRSFKCLRNVEESFKAYVLNVACRWSISLQIAFDGISISRNDEKLQGFE
jgi:hypothetical protein